MTGVWLAVILLAVAASLLYTNLVTAQESSTEATLSAPALTAEAGEGEGAVELRWEAVTGAARYELLVWTSADGFQDIGGDNLTGTTYSHTGLAAGHDLLLHGACGRRWGRDRSLVGVCLCDGCRGALQAGFDSGGVARVRSSCVGRR